MGVRLGDFMKKLGRYKAPKKRPKKKKSTWLGIAGLKNYEYAVNKKKGQTIEREWSNWAGDTEYGKVTKRRILKYKW